LGVNESYQRAIRDLGGWENYRIICGIVTLAIGIWWKWKGDSRTEKD